MTDTARPRKAEKAAGRVWFNEVTYHPTATCRGVWAVGDEGEDVQLEECGWRLVLERGGPDPRTFKKLAREHVAERPGHEVAVERRTVALYWAHGLDSDEGAGTDG